MSRQSVLEYFQPNSRPSDETAVVWKRGYRTMRWKYSELLRVAHRFAYGLHARGLAKGDRVMLWGENSGEWMAAFLGCLFFGATAVPMDAIAEKSFAERVARQASVKLVVADRSLPPLTGVEDTLWFEQLSEEHNASSQQWPPTVASPEDPIQIVFTSGTTAEPRGVVITHGNILANLEPLEKESARYRRYERIVHPLRFLDLLPLSHVFGQLLGIFIPQFLGATAIFLDTLNPAEVIRAIRSEKVSVLIAVPRLLESLGDQVERDISSGKIEQFRRDFRAAEGEHFLKRWWRFRAIHRRFGWKFWAVISGGATLPAKTETFWARIGYAVIQGYGLTETTSLVSVNHPFRLGRGSIGKALPGRDVKLADDGEILVRGASIAAGYWTNAGIAPVRDAEGWFHTGDLGERDASGQLYFKGRRKNVIVTPEGLNVYPQDLEAELRKEPAVRDCVVIGLDRDGNAEPCAALLLRDSKDDDQARQAVQSANQRLASFQQMRNWFVWPEQDFPRTPTQKPALAKIRAVAEAHFRPGQSAAASASENANPLSEVLQRIAARRPFSNNADAPLELSSIERVELLSELENRYQVDLSETEFSRVNTASGLQQLLAPSAEPNVAFHYPRWAQSWPVRIFRALMFHLAVRPVMFVRGWPRVRGRESLRNVRGPLLVVANHVTYFDPVYVMEALPTRFRGKLAIAIGGERLESMRNPPPGTAFWRALMDRANYFLVVSVFNVFPLPRRSGFRKSFAFAGDLMDRGWNVLVFPEGAETVDGRMLPFRNGIGLLALRLRVPVVPIYLAGLGELKVAGQRWALPGKIKVLVGSPVEFPETLTPEEIARQLQRLVASLGGAEDTAAESIRDEGQSKDRQLSRAAPENNTPPPQRP